MTDDLFYKPHLKPERNYMTEAEVQEWIDENQSTNIEEPEEIIDELEELLDKVDGILDVLDILPSDMESALRPSLLRIRRNIQEIEPPSAETEDEDGFSEGDDGSSVFTPSDPEGSSTGAPAGNSIDGSAGDGQAGLGELPGTGESSIGIGSSDPGEGQFTLPSLLPRKDFIPVTVVPPKSLRVVMNDTFAIDKTEIYKDFVNRLRLAIERYMREVLYISQIGGFPSYQDLFYSYNLPAENLPIGMLHIGDGITRSQIQRGEKAKFFRKVYNIDQTIYHLRANKSAHELRQRYYDAEFTSSRNYLDTNTNDLLKASRLEYDKKYQQNMYNFYKYLNSAVILVDEVLQTFVIEAKGKAALHKKGVDINKGMREEQELAEKVRKQREERMTKRREETIKTNKDRLARYKSAGRGANSSQASTPTTAPASSGSNAKVVELAKEWAQTRGPNSSNPVIYSMERRGSDMELKKYGDCSSFTRRIFLDAGKSDIGWTTAQQATNKKGHFFTNRGELQPGDVMIFNPTGSHGHPVKLPNGQTERTAHVAIFIGGTVMIDLAYGTGGITTKDFGSGQHKSYVDNHFIGAMRF